MKDNAELFEGILGLRAPWYVTDVELRVKQGDVTVMIAAHSTTKHACPRCGKACAGYDTRRRTFRHLDTCEYKTIIIVDVPRVKCLEHGVLQIDVPWAAPDSGFTVQMECAIIDWLLEASISAVARRMQLTWDEIDGVKQRAVKRGLARRKLKTIQHVGVDETSFQKRHEYVTVVNDLDSGNVVYVADDRTHESLDGFWCILSPEQLRDIKAVAMDMSPSYIRSTREHLENADSKICFDRFHVAKLLNDAVNTVRKQENRELAAEGSYVPARTKYVWIQNPENMPADRHHIFDLLRTCSLKAGRAWAYKDAARKLWGYATHGWAVKGWKRWIVWAMRSQLEPIKHAARTIRDRLWGIVNAVVLGVTNAGSESQNAKIQWIKKQACGFRSRDRFRNAIYFHLGGLDLYPRT
jgi:transposase